MSNEDGIVCLVLFLSNVVGRGCIACIVIVSNFSIAGVVCSIGIEN